MASCANLALPVLPKVGKIRLWILAHAQARKVPYRDDA